MPDVGVNISQEKKNFMKQIDKAAKIVQENTAHGELIRILSHIDADGLSAASIIGQALNRVDVPFRIRIEKQLDEESIEELATEEGSLIIFTDLGSGSIDIIESKLSKNKIIILDHHQPLDISNQNICHVNPHLFGFDGSTEISGAGVTYLVSKSIDRLNADLAPMAVIGALGDMQDKNENKSLIGLNEEIVKDAIDSGRMKVESDLIFYGRETRPVHKAIAYTINPYIPDLSGEEDKCLGFLVNLGIRLKDNDRWRSISDLSVEEKQNIFSEIVKHLTTRNYPNNVAQSLIGKIYTLIEEDRWTPLRDAREFSSLLNACGRLKKSDLGIAIGIGSRGKTLDEAQELFSNYKKTLSEHLEWIHNNPGSIKRLKNINVVDGSGVIDELILSVIASILTSSNFFEDTKPVIALTTAEDKTVKISGRIPIGPKKSRLNLGEVFLEASTRLNGRGGGHDVAAGANLPKENEEEFIRVLDQLIGKTLNKK